MMRVEVVYASVDKESLLEVSLKEHATVRDAIHLSGILELYPEIDLDQNAVGVFSEKVTLSTRLNNGDRIEIYRPLTIDPKEARRLRALKK